MLINIIFVMIFFNQHFCLSQYKPYFNSSTLTQYLKSKDGKDWSCQIENKTVDKTPLYYFCFYKYECKNIEKIFMSENFSKSLLKLNKSNNIKRGADFQCEKMLKIKTNSEWNCKLYKNKKSTVTIAEKIYCNCFSNKICQNERIIHLTDLIIR
jgi:hypothetical protein